MEICSRVGLMCVSLFSYYDPHNVYISDIAVTPFISDDKHFEDPSIYREALYEVGPSPGFLKRLTVPCLEPTDSVSGFPVAAERGDFRCCL